jgi:hypothetical protein
MRGIAVALTVGGWLAAMATAPAAEDFGDYTSATLTGKAWQALAAGDFDKVGVFVGKCRELYAAEAGKQQGGLTDFLPADKAHGVWALNDVGTCCFIEGQAFEKQGRKTEAAAAYKTLTTSYRFAQCWDPKGWFWRPAEAAAGRLDQLDFDAVLDAK